MKTTLEQVCDRVFQLLVAFHGADFDPAGQVVREFERCFHTLNFPIKP
jgi:hypothetical protein